MSLYRKGAAAAFVGISPDRRFERTKQSDRSRGGHSERSAGKRGNKHQYLASALPARCGQLPAAEVSEATSSAHT